MTPQLRSNQHEARSRDSTKDLRESLPAPPCLLYARSKPAAGNGAKARGLKTPAGIANSSLNALKHGLSAKTVVLPGESHDEYDAILNEYLDEFQPQSIAERDAVEQLATAKWRARRFAGVEAAAISNEIENMSDRISARYDDIDDTTRIALAFRSLADSSRCLHLLDRYNSTAHREHQRFLQRPH